MPDQTYTSFPPRVGLSAVRISRLPNLWATTHNAPGKLQVGANIHIFPSGCPPFFGYVHLSLSPDVLSFAVWLYRTSSSISMKLSSNSNGIYSGLNEHNRATENTITRQLSNLSIGLTTSQTRSLVLHCQQNYVWLFGEARYKHWNGSLQLGIAAALWEEQRDEVGEQHHSLFRSNG